LTKITRKKVKKIAAQKTVSNPNKFAEETVEESLENIDLNPRHELFVVEFVSNGFHGTKAYQKVFECSEDVARKNASRLLTNADIKKAIRTALDKLIAKMEITPERVLQEIAKMAFANMGEYIAIQEDGSAYVDLSKVDMAGTAAIQEVVSDEYAEGRGEDARVVKRVKLKLADKTRNLELLGKYLKLFSESTPASSTQTATILQEVFDGTMSVREAAYKFNILGLPLPEVLKIELSKQEPEEPDTPPGTSDEDLLQRAQEALDHANRQREQFLPQRQAEVQELKENMKHVDSFGPTK